MNRYRIVKPNGEELAGLDAAYVSGLLGITTRQVSHYAKKEEKINGFLIFFDNAEGNNLPADKLQEFDVVRKQFQKLQWVHTWEPGVKKLTINMKKR